LTETPAEPRPALPLLLLAPALLWAATLVAVCGFALPPGPGSARNWAVLVLLAAGVAGVHGGLFALAAALAGRLGGRAGRAANLALAAAWGSLYALLLLSLAKFVLVHAHVRASDFGFLAPSWLQVAGEGTAAERAALALALLLPFLLAALLFALLRAARRRGAPRGFRAPAALLAGALALLGALAALAPAARWAAATLLPESALPALGRSAARALAARAGALGSAGTAPALPAYRPQPPRARANVVLVMLESVPWQRLLGPEARPESTPRLLALAREAIVFERAYAVSSHSDYAQTGILAAQCPRRFEHHDFFADLAHPRALPWDVLGAAGWRSGLFSSQNERWGNLADFVVTPALGTFRHALDFPDAPRRGAGAETKLFEQTAVEAFFAWLDRPDEPGASGGADAPPSLGSTTPFVAALNFQATHFPYVWPASFAPPYGPAPLDFGATFLAYPRSAVPRMLDRFHNALAYADLWLGRLVDGLRARGLWESTALALVADHGEAFYEHGVPTHGTTLHDEQVRVPMLLRLPPALAGTGGGPRAIAEPVSTLDLLPTLYRALGLPRHGALQGRDDLLEPGYSGARRGLLLTIQGMTNEDALVLGEFKWIVNRDRRQGALYRLADDPAERANRLRAEPEIARAMAAELDRLLALQLDYYRRRLWERGLFPPRLP
jgi:hypothetical protein